MDTLLSYLSSTDTLLYKWQELIGSLLGVFGAISTVFLGLALNHYYQKYKELRENLRNTEIALALSLGDIFDTEKHLEDFLERLEEAVMAPLRLPQSPTAYFFNKTNFPSLIVHFDNNLLKGRFTSYYIHNKVLILHKNTEQSNRMLKEMKLEYEKIFDTAKFLMTQGATPTNQQHEYLSHHESFITFTHDVIEQLQIAKKAFAQAKIYNLKLLQGNRYQVWKLEGVSFKFFWNRGHIKDYKSSLECLDRVEEAIETEVKDTLTAAEERRDEVEKTKYYGLQLQFENIWETMKKWFSR